MFTGIIETVGAVRASRRQGTQMRLRIDLGPLADGTRLGDSIAVNGVCLTVCARHGTVADFDVSAETVTTSSLTSLTSGSAVNLERAMAANGRFGGHIVQGHIDGTGRIAAIGKEADFAVFRFAAAAALLDQMVLKGSVAVDGVSVTVAALDATGFEVAVIPTTLKDTTWHAARVGDVVNIETDILIKAVKRQLENMLPASDGLTRAKLTEYGF